MSLDFAGFSFFNSQPQNDQDRGAQALTWFHNDMTSFDNYTWTYKQLVDFLNTDHTTGFLDTTGAFTEGLGLAINSIGMSDSQVQDAMQKLASASNGQIPANRAVFTKALSDRMQDITAGDWINALPSIAADTAADVAKGAQKVGSAVIATGSILTKIAPILITAAVVLIGWAYTKKAEAL